MSEEQGFLEKAKEKFIDAKDATKNKFGEIQHKVTAIRRSSLEVPKKLNEFCKMNSKSESLDENSTSEAKNFNPFKSDESDDGITF
uniref:PvLEA14 protein n=1 Tax=Polypedilum vanderplanki TaxID=319348 RepID=S6CDI5_POLVA|nr:PvLEA14 protein [Polypedilum vanderplanki]